MKRITIRTERINVAVIKQLEALGYEVYVQIVSAKAATAGAVCKH